MVYDFFLANREAPFWRYSNAVCSGAVYSWRYGNRRCSGAVLTVR